MCETIWSGILAVERVDDVIRVWFEIVRRCTWDDWNVLIFILMLFIYTVRVARELKFPQ